jgi:hypothetical protein
VDFKSKFQLPLYNCQNSIHSLTLSREWFKIGLKVHQGHLRHFKRLVLLNPTRATLSPQ